MASPPSTPPAGTQPGAEPTTVTTPGSTRAGEIRVRDLVVSFAAGRGEGLVALDGIDLEVAPGEIVSLIGPNGSGKSTLLRAIAGLIPPDRGDVLVGGSRVEGPDARIGLVFQEPRLLPWRSTAKNVAYPLELAGWGRSRTTPRIAELLRLVGLETAAASLPRELSGGMRQRAALARALALEPDVLLLDEPFSALDALTRERFNLELLKLWARARRTILVVTHSIPEAIFLADRVVVLSEGPGRVVAEIPIGLRRPRSLDDLDGAVVTAAARQIRAHLRPVSS